MADASQYDLVRIHEGPELTLYRGRERGGDEPVLAVVEAAKQPSPQNLRRLEHEYALASDLDTAWAARPLALTRYRGRAALILTDPGGKPLNQVIEGQRELPIDLARTLRIAIGLAATLRQVHRQGLVHRDISPANVLVDDNDHVWLTGFGIASRVPRERQSPQAPEFLAGSFPYMAPERTGRMNRSIDSRSDLYSFGAVLYQLMTGRLPFAASDPIEWVHCHIARQPVAPSERTPGIPGPASAIIMKLLAKTPEDRFQTALGVERDLQRCLEEWETHGQIVAFRLGEHDKPDRLRIPEKLYGRARHIDALVASFERVASGGRPELVLISGYSGSGKSTLVNELQKPLVPLRGTFVSGKFDQYKRDMPYATLAQALQGLIRPILSKSQEDLLRWRDAIREALSPNGQLMIDLVPDLKLIIGAQQPVPELAPQDAQNRLQLVIRRFIGVFTQDHPLALFLDDLQWLDAATLDLMQALLTDPGVKDLMIIGAYRDNEVDPAHPLMQKLRLMPQVGAIVHDIVLAPLTRDDLKELVADSLHCARERAEPLAALVQERTAGNPLFSIQFISALFEEGLLCFDHVEGEWRWDLNRIHTKNYTDNVVDLMVERLRRLPDETQKRLQLLASLGNSADLATLSAVCELTPEQMHERLWEALRAGLVFRSDDDSYTFLHDRVQEAAYTLIPQEQRDAAHLHIGWSMVSRLSPDKLVEEIFEIVNQLNRGSHLITSIAERKQLARLNLIAGQRAKGSAAYASALKYLHAGNRLLTNDSWKDDYDLLFQIEYLLAICELLTGNMSASENRLSMLARRATSTHDISLVTRSRLTLYNLLDRGDRAMEVFLEYQRARGQKWSPKPSDEEVTREYDQIWRSLGTRKIEELIGLPLLSNSDVLDALGVFTEIVMNAMSVDENLHALLLCRMVNLSLEHGNSDASCFAYVSLGMLAGPQFGNYEAGFQFGKLAYDVVEKHGLYRARTYLRFGICILPWKQHVITGRELVQRAFDIADRNGDLTCAAYCRHHLNTNFLANGDTLDKVQQEAEVGLALAQRLRFGRVIDQIRVQLALVRTLRGLTRRFGGFDDDTFDEPEFERQLKRGPTVVLLDCWYWIRKLQARLFSQDYLSAIEASSNAERLLWTSHSFFEVAEYHFYAALARAGAFDVVTEGSKQEHFEALTLHYGQLAIWSDHCPENFASRSTLVAAEIARIEGRDLDSMRLYEQALRSAHANGFVHIEAIAYELAGRYYLSRDLETCGDLHLRNARGRYESWGAIGKVKQLDERFPRLRDAQALPSSAPVGFSLGQLDVETVVRASQAISGEIVLTAVIEKLMRLAVEQAGAERGLLILFGRGFKEREPTIEAEATTGPNNLEVSVRQRSVSASDIPQSVLHHLMRKQEAVLLDDARDSLYSQDRYVLSKGTRSVLCVPIIKQAKLMGAIYLENGLTASAFTPERATVLGLLASQAAISLENADLYSDRALQVEVLQRLPVSAWTLKPDGTPEFVNQVWLEFAGQTREFVQSHPEAWMTAIHPEDREGAAKAFWDGVHLGQGFAMETRSLRARDQTYRWHLQQAVALRDSQGNVIKFVGTTTDIDDQKRAEEALRQAQDELARINRVTTLGELAASVAHELSQPLSGAITNANTCLRKLASGDVDLNGVREVVVRFARDAQRATDIISKIRSQFRRGAPSRELIDINELGRETVALLRDVTTRYSILVRTDFDEALPPIAGDRVQLQQVVMNLIVNSIEAMQDVAGVRELSIRSRRAEAQQILVSISDTGTGFAPQLAQRLFEPFFTTKPNGTGMGLRICRSILESHNGRLWAVPNDGPGATFSFSIPCKLDGLAQIQTTG